MLKDDGEFIFTKAAWGKCVIGDIEWANLRCRKCDVQLVMDDHSSNDNVDFKVCPVCGETYARIKRVNYEQ